MPPTSPRNKGRTRINHYDLDVNDKVFIIAESPAYLYLYNMS